MQLNFCCLRDSCAKLHAMQLKFSRGNQIIIKIAESIVFGNQKSTKCEKILLMKEQNKVDG
jgi:hypothetical protein